MFLAQDYAEKELIILDDGTDQIRDIVPPVMPRAGLSISRCSEGVA
jgi:hypothetical protein